jgi:coenzyme F420-0:L-glutamate ligase / coenzyme F420-1:gamma-L-glutamate ligase
MRGVDDRDKRPLASTSIGLGDELAAAASLLMGQAAEGIPAVIIRGYPYPDSTETAADLLRPEPEDMFR